MAIEAEECDPVTRVHPLFPQSAGESTGTFRELRVGEPPLSADHGGLVGELLFGIAEEPYRRKRNIHGLCVTRLTDLHPQPAHDR